MLISSKTKVSKRFPPSALVFLVVDSVVVDVVEVDAVSGTSILKPGGKSPTSGSSAIGILNPGGKRPAKGSTIRATGGGEGISSVCCSGSSGLIELKNVSTGPTGC